jgi:hypothetical protein
LAIKNIRRNLPGIQISVLKELNQKTVFFLTREEITTYNIEKRATLKKNSFFKKSGPNGLENQ